MKDMQVQTLFWNGRQFVLRPGRYREDFIQAMDTIYGEDGWSYDDRPDPVSVCVPNKDIGQWIEKVRFLKLVFGGREVRVQKM